MGQVVSTARILADKALRETCGQQCIDWAIQLLELGHDGDYLGRLAGKLPPHNHFELAALRDQVLIEQSILEPVAGGAVVLYTVELAENFLEGESETDEFLNEMNRLYRTGVCESELNNLWLLSYAYIDLQKYGDQHYWTDATRENIESLVLEHAERFVEIHKRS